MKLLFLKYALKNTYGCNTSVIEYKYRYSYNHQALSLHITTKLFFTEETGEEYFLNQTVEYNLYFVNS